MPCRDDYGPCYTNPDTQRRLDRATRIACEALRELNKTGRCQSPWLSAEAQQWWNTHQEADRRREKQEEEAARRAALKASAVSKLTKEERKALGL